MAKKQRNQMDKNSTSHIERLKTLVSKSLCKELIEEDIALADSEMADWDVIETLAQMLPPGLIFQAPNKARKEWEEIVKKHQGKRFRDLPQLMSKQEKQFLKEEIEGVTDLLAASFIEMMAILRLITGGNQPLLLDERLLPSRTISDIFPNGEMGEMKDWIENFEHMLSQVMSPENAQKLYLDFARNLALEIEKQGGHYQISEDLIICKSLDGYYLV